METKNVIIGAGLSGLSCGHVLKDRCIILEKEPHIGGLATTKAFGDFKFDLGGHRFFTSNHSIKRFFLESLEGEIIEANRKSKIYRTEKFIDYPLKASVVFQLNPADIALSLSSYIFRKIKPLKEHSFSERAINRFGDHLFKLFFRDYTQKVWGINCKNISKELVDSRLQNISLLRVIRHAFIKEEGVRSFTDKLLYPKEGIGMIAECLSEGLDIRLDSEITELICSDNRIEKIIVDNSKEYICENVVSTMPLARLVEFFSAPHYVKDAANSLRYRSLICVFIILNKESYSQNHWIYFPGKEMFGRIHEPKNWSSFMAPAGKTGVCVEIFCDKGDAVWKMTDTEIAHQAIRTLPLLREFEAEEHCTVRVEYAYPVYDIDYKKNIEALKSYLSAYKNLFLLGRTGSFRYINMDTCIEDGLRLGEFLNKESDGIYSSGYRTKRLELIGGAH